MTFSLTEAVKISQTALQTEIISAFASADPFLSWLPFEPKDGNAFVYNRENALGNADYVANDGTITAVQGTFTQVSKAWKMIVRDEEIPNLIARTSSGRIDQYAESIRRGTKACALHFMEKLITGDETSNAEEIDGLDHVIDDAPFSTQVVYAGANSTTPATISFAKLDELIDKASLSDLANAALIVPRRTRRSILSLMRSMGGTTPEFVTMNGMNVLMYEGIPVFANDYMGVTFDDSTAGGNNESRVYLVSKQPVSGAVVFVPTASPVLTAENPIGVEIEDLGSQSTKDNKKIRCKFYHGFAVRGGLQFSWLSNVTN